MAVTLNPSDKGADVTLSGGNLTASIAAGSAHGARGTLGVTSGKYYFEYTMPTVTAGSNTCIGIADGSASLSTSTRISATTNATLYRPADGKIEHNASGTSYGMWTGGDIVGVAFEVGVSISFYKNNSLVATVTSGSIPTGGTWYPAVGGSGAGTAHSGTLAFTAGSWTYSAPSGYGELSEPVLASFSGAGAVTSTATMVEQAAASFSPIGALIANAIVRGENGQASFAGDSNLIASVGLLTINNPATFGGAGFLYAGTRLDPRAAVAWVGAGALTVAETHIVPQHYVLADEDVPDGGIVWAGSPSITENIPFIPTSGITWGGSATVAEAIKFVPSGGLVWGGTTENYAIYPVTPTGGFVWGGTPAVTVVFASPTITGGFVWGGASPVTTYAAWHAPSGGVVWGGTARAWVETADYTASAENPNNEPFYGWTMNADTATPSRYYRLPATSMCQHNGVTYVTTAAGVYEFGAEDDAGQDIRASVQFPKTDFATALTKRMEVAYFGVKSDGRLRLKLVANDDDPRYYVIQPTNDGLKGTRVTIGKGMAGRYWAARLDNVAGSDLELDSAEFLPVRSHHRHGA